MPDTVTGSLVVIYAPYFVADHRQNLRDMANAMTVEVWWCPLRSVNHPSMFNTVETEWTRDYKVSSGNRHHSIGYNMLFLIENNGAPVIRARTPNGTTRTRSTLI